MRGPITRKCSVFATRYFDCQAHLLGNGFAKTKKKEFENFKLNTEIPNTIYFPKTLHVYAGCPKNLKTVE